MESIYIFGMDSRILLTLVFGLFFILLAWIIVLEIRLRRFLKGSSGKSLEGLIQGLTKHKEDMVLFKNKLEQYLESVEFRLRRSVQAVETLRFNPFKGDGSGGNQSFSAAFISEEGDGVVLSSIYARDRVSTYAKPVRTHSSDYELTEEEIEVLEKAKALLAQSSER